MATLTVGPQGTYATLAAAIAAAAPGDTITLQYGFNGGTVDLGVDNLTFDGLAATQAVFNIKPGVSNVNFLGTGRFDVIDSATSTNTTINGNSGPNSFSISNGADVVNGGGDRDRLLLDYSTATTNVIGTPTQFTASADRSVVFSGIESLVVRTGSGNDNLTFADAPSGEFNASGADTGAGNDVVVAGDGKFFLNLGEGNNQATVGNAQSDIMAGSGDDIIIATNGTTSINAGHGNNRITVGNATSVIQTGNGADIIIVGDGRAAIASGDGDDVITAGSGDSKIDGGNGNDTINAGGGRDELIGFEGNDSLDGGEGRDQVDGGNGDDILSGGNGDDILNGGDGDDILSGGKDDDILNGGNGADILNGGEGIDTAAFNQSVVAFLLAPAASTGEAAGDTFIGIENLTGSQAGDILGGNEDANTIDGLGGNNYIYGAGGDDILGGGENDDLLEGQGGNDTLSGRAGIDILNGGDGDDTASYASGLGVIAYLSAPQLNAGDAAGDSYISIENLTGSIFTDYLGGTDAGNVISGNGGNDFIYGAGGDDFLNGGLGGDALDGQAGYDYASYADAASGVVAFLGGAAFNTGEAAGDSYTSIEGVIGSAYADFLAGDEGNNTILGGSGNDLLFGGGGEDYLVGGDGDDQLQGGRGADLLDGGNGLDLVSYSEAAAGVVAFMLAPQGNAGEAQNDGYANIEGLVGSAFGDILGGTEGANTIRGGGGNDYIFAAGGDDIIEGGDGGDQLSGQAGADALTGGAGADQFVFRAASDSSNAAFDTITDFQSGSDLIDLRGSGLGTVAISQSGGFFFVDADTSGGAHFHLRVAGTVVAGDILTGALPGDGIASAAPADDIGFLAYAAFNNGALITLLPGHLSPDFIV
ncbi:hypothetical protein sos41_35310 [Alphaproteobacteria bacterium SO-S41]|nr:hypothetical protein sos41_35310 [Alphaproteobacteria bacterium SO-S41]